MQRFLSAICFLSLLGDAPAQDKPPQPTKADDLPIIAPMSGPLCVWRATAKKPERIKTSIGIAPHDRIGTPAGEYALFIVERDTLVSLKGLTVAADSGLSLEQSGDRLTLRLHEGRMALEAYGVKTTVETPHARAEGEGVYYLIEVTKSKSTVTVSDGEVKLVGSLGSASVTVGPGQRSSVDSKGPPTKPDKSSGELDAERERLNLLRNPGFEQGMAPWSTDALENADCRDVLSIDDAVSHSGKKSLRIELDSRKIGALPRPTRYWVLDQCVPYVKGERYFLQAYVRAKSHLEGVDPIQPSLAMTQGPRPPAAAARAKFEDRWRMARLIETSPNDKGWAYLAVDLPASDYHTTIWVDDFFLARVASASE